MVSLAVSYNEASGRKRKTLESFKDLARGISLPTNEHDAAVSLKENLRKLGFSYDPLTFRLDEILETRKGNCLGIPVLMAAIMEEKGYSPKLRIIVNPKDAVYHDEHRTLTRINEETSYNAPTLAQEISEFPFHRFAPLEHLVIESSGGIIETTSGEHTFPGAESTREITAAQAISCIYKDRAIVEGSQGRIKIAKKLLEKAVGIWSKNRQAYSTLAKIAIAEKDEDAFERNKTQFEICDGDDSYFYFQRFLLGGDVRDLDKSLQIYSPYAEAIAMKAHVSKDKDSREARFLYSIASQLYSDSSVLNYTAFLVNHSANLKELFGAERIKTLIRKSMQRTK